ncbi:hypothetical protein T4B_1059 [Trichinella pseudospiralis]|uniref:Uncharacterized protein n=1 Tax=Trichinella pseudospiralis TaxID=6337 RepID=A0A0V1IN98_TRIPS|nr:hypothetical protein T4A_8373 [Trichinella pseudospiralis]KRZ24303.1 hypothetical protein T4B_1059 [Trichinella pseudospiralis]
MGVFRNTELKLQSCIMVVGGGGRLSAISVQLKIIISLMMEIVRQESSAGQRRGKKGGRSCTMEVPSRVDFKHEGDVSALLRVSRVVDKSVLSS